MAQCFTLCGLNWPVGALAGMFLICSRDPSLQLWKRGNFTDWQKYGKHLDHDNVKRKTVHPLPLQNKHCFFSLRHCGNQISSFHFLRHHICNLCKCVFCKLNIFLFDAVNSLKQSYDFLSVSASNEEYQFLSHQQTKT